MLTYKRKLKLTKDQEKRVLNWIGTCRVIYNMGLEIKVAAYRKNKQSVTHFDLVNQLTTIKDIDWIADVPNASLAASLQRLDNAYKVFFRKHKAGGGFPKFKSKKSDKSITFKRDIRLIDNKTIRLPKLGAVKFFKDKSPIIGKIKQAHLIKEPTGYFISVVCDEVTKNIQCIDENQVLGIDMGISHFYTDSNGIHASNPKHFKKHERKLRIENRSLSRKKRGSNSWKKQCQRVRLIHHKIANVRRDYLHKESTRLARSYNTVYMEKLNITGMVKSNISSQILDCGWYMFREMLSYKTNVIAIDPKYTSQTCHECGCVDGKNRMSQNEFVCTKCGHISNADTNAAKNILSKGIALNRKREALA